jgi:hypothetical protein
MNTTDNVCNVCAEPVEPHTEALCGSCGKTFHLNQRTDMLGKDCGEVWINPEHLGLEFTCQDCLGAPPPEGAQPSALDDILDLAEAAAVLGIPETELSDRALRGEVPHRQTSGGLLLFDRSTITALREGMAR